MIHRRLNTRHSAARLIPGGLLVCACLFAVLATSLNAQPALEYEVKAAFLLNFTKFIDWPPTAFADATAPFAVCVVGKDPFGRALADIIQGETVNGRRLAVKTFAETPRAQQCQVMFFGGSDRDAGSALRDIGPGVLTVGEGARFLQDGGMIAFVLENRRVRFDINQGAAERAGLKLSSKLLSVARVVEK